MGRTEHRSSVAVFGAAALSVPGVHGFCTPGDLDLLRACLVAARRFVPLDAAQREAASAQVAHEEMIFPMPTG